jgi:uncharacterized glyoxalase superfamily protein PhnB
MTLRLELFVDDLAAAIDFYCRVLEFKLGEAQADGYTPLTNGKVQLALNRRDTLSDDHPIRLTGSERPGRGIEIVLEVDDVAAMYEHVLSQNWPVAGPLQSQPWGTTDFRVIDPDGFYLRLTSRA